MCELNHFWVGKGLYCAPCWPLGGFKPPGEGNCTKCADPYASASELDDGTGSPCTCPTGWGQRMATPPVIQYGQPTPAPVPICDRCESGFSPTGYNVFGVNSYCVQCAAGWFQTKLGAAGNAPSKCTMCSAGFYANSGQRDKCLPCPAGTSSLPGYASQAADCTPCPLGVSWSAGKGGACKPCTPISCGKGLRNLACSATQDASCVPCAPNTVQIHNSQPATTLNTSCPACYSNCSGDASSGYWNTPCTNLVDTVCLCAGGYSSLQPSNTTLSALKCHACRNGQYSAGGPAPVRCVDCFNGTFSPPGSHGCMQCQDVLGVAYADTPNDPGDGSTCTCPGGYSQDGFGEPSQCSPCGGGAVSQPGDSFCTTCEAGTFASEEDSLNGLFPCTPCAPGTFSSAGAAACLPCFPGSFAAFGGAIPYCSRVTSRA